MKQVFQDLKTGETRLEDVPCPKCVPGHLLIKTNRTLISSGTERMLVDFGKANLVNKARQQPDKVKQVFEKIQTDGLVPTISAVRNKLDQPLPLGYCNVGVVVEVGQGVEGFSIGDRVASNGSHAEYVSVPKNLCAKIPDNVDDDAAAFTVVAAIALQGVRLLSTTLGESVVVIGLGLIGQIAVQLLHASGCRVIGVDFNAGKVDVAGDSGATTVDLSKGEDLLTVARRFSHGRGIDAVLIAASTKSNEPVSQAAKICRKRGRIVLVGVVGLEISRADFYEKELTFQVSCSYGPGRYDPDYEALGKDYPIGYVRWTEQRNFEAVLDLLSAKKLDTSALVTRRFDLTDVGEAYETIGNSSSLGVMLDFSADMPMSNITRPERSVRITTVRPESGVRVAFVGAGNYATSTLIPAFAKTDAALVAVSSTNGTSAAYIARKCGIGIATTDTRELIQGPANNVIVITTRHDSHATLVQNALEAKKHVFVEKPLAITYEGLDAVERAYAQHAIPAGLQLAVGFNRRFSPLTVRMRDLLSVVSEPKSFVMTVNAGAIAAEHWTQNKTVGGGRFLGEACHFFDLLRFLADAPIETTCVMQIGNKTSDGIRNDKVTASMTFADGSFGTVHYFANGNKGFPKERLEVFCGGRVLQLDNFRKLLGYGWSGFRSMRLLRQDKGHRNCVAAFVTSVRTGGGPIIPFEQLVEVSRVCLKVNEQLHS